MKISKPPKNNLREFFGYINERDRIRRKRWAGEPKPWTSDPALQQYRFTNVKRDLDRTSKSLQKIYLQHQEAPAGEIIFNCAMYRYFGTAEFAHAVGWVRQFNPQHIIDLATQQINARTAVFTGAYVITNGGVPAPKQNVVSERYLWPLWQARKRIAGAAVITNRWERTARAMMAVPGFGGTGFMTKEALLDVMYFPLLANAKDKATWTLAGPGARKGLNLLFDRPEKQSVPMEQMLAEMRWLLDKAPKYLDKEVPEFDVLHDIQWNLCEYSKLRNIRQGGRGKRTFTPTDEPKPPTRTKNKPLTKEQCIEIYEQKCKTGATNWELAKQFGLTDDKMAHRAIHRAMERNWVDPEKYEQFHAPGRRY